MVNIGRASSHICGLFRARWLLRGFQHGRGVWFGRGVGFSAPRGAQILIGEKVRLMEGCGIGVGHFGDASPSLSIGPRTYLQPRSRINASIGVVIGSDCAISWDVDIIDNDFHAIIHADGASRPIAAAISIGDRVWIGLGAKILKGATIGNDSVVAAGAVVTGQFPAKSLIAGVPARRVKDIGGWRP